MQDAVPVGKGAMLAILGSTIDEVNQLITKFNKNGVCEIANDNSDGQTIVSGNKESVTDLLNILKKKKKAILLPVSAPFHCSLMKGAAKKMKEKIEPVNFEKLNFEIISNVTALPENDPKKIKTLLVEQIYTKSEMEREHHKYVKKWD